MTQSELFTAYQAAVLVLAAAKGKHEESVKGEAFYKRQAAKRLALVEAAEAAVQAAQAALAAPAPAQAPPAPAGTGSELAKGGKKA